MTEFFGPLDNTNETFVNITFVNETFVNITFVNETFVNNLNIEAKQDEINRRGYVGLYIALSPLLFVGGILILVFLINEIILPLKYQIKKIKIKIINRYESSKLPIVNNKLNKSYIKKLNEENLNKHTNMCHTECSICLEQINNKKKIVLDCGHTFDTSCLQKWTSTQVSAGKKPECPLCRGDIVRQEDYKFREYIVVNMNYDSDSSARTTLSDL
jgi:hypothetical protein